MLFEELHDHVNRIRSGLYIGFRESLICLIFEHVSLHYGPLKRCSCFPIVFIWFDHNQMHIFWHFCVPSLLSAFHFNVSERISILQCNSWLPRLFVAFYNILLVSMIFLIYKRPSCIAWRFYSIADRDVSIPEEYFPYPIVLHMCSTIWCKDNPTISRWWYRWI